jgi:4-hydroxybenzoate polyprenyltransferase
LLWLWKGKAVLKERLASKTEIDVSALPYSHEVIGVIEAARRSGRTIVLATASDRRFAEQVAEHLGIFDEVIASNGRLNLSAQCKRDTLVARFGKRGFDYIGNSHDDLPTFAAARRAFLVAPQPGLTRRASRLGDHVECIPSDRADISDWLEAMRLHQWVKNVLVFVPLLASHQIGDPLLLSYAVVAFVLFGLCASSVYLLNDLLDLPEDRQHPLKRHRPFAAGRLSIKTGLVMTQLLLVSAFGGALWLLPWESAGVLAAYYVLTLAYTVDLKRRMVMDVIILAALYTLRVIAGATAMAIAPTFWMLAFSMFMFLCLALVKRYAELHAAASQGRTGQTPGRGYFPADTGMIAAMGAAAGYLSVLVLALYIQDEATAALYSRPQIIWLACPLLLYWISRVWMLTHRGKMNEDPILFAVRDPVSLTVGFLFGLVFLVAT